LSCVKPFEKEIVDQRDTGCLWYTFIPFFSIGPS
jgi:hypothetical protein